MVGASAKDVSIDSSSTAIASTEVDSSNPTDFAIVVSPPGASTRPSDSKFVVVVVVAVAFVGLGGAFTAAGLSKGFQLER